ncbi:Holliday junction resolvase [Candidatus Woesearchaeota archaeon]|nr:Holliday junction resolvase [Candidatus Woesearchaeota archaeon]
MAGTRNSKAKGTQAERDLIHKFWDSGWAAMRAAGSGSSQYPSPDIVAGKYGRRLAIECKITKETKKYFPSEEIRLLNYFSKTFCAEAWVAVKFPKLDWMFFNPEDLNEAGNSFSASVGLAELKGLSFEELIKT